MLRTTPLGICKVDLGARRGRVAFGPRPSVEPAKVIQLIQKEPACYRLEGGDRIRLLLDLPNAEGRVRALSTLLGRLGAR